MNSSSPSELTSIIVVNFNSGDYLIRCVESAFGQAAEVIVVDNASADGSIEQCRQHFSGEPKLRIISNEANLGFAAACNIGIRASTGKFLFFLNPDCVLSPAVVEEMATPLCAQPDVGMVGGLLVNPDGSEQGGGRRAVPTPWRSFVRAFGLNRYAERWPKLFYDFYLHLQPLPPHPIDVEAISGACMLVRRDVVDQVGIWDEGYFLHCEDLDWCMRFRQAGWRILFVPAAVVMHVHGVCSASRPLFVEWHKHRGMIRFYRKFFLRQYPGVLMWLVVIGVWLRFAAFATLHFARLARDAIRKVVS